MKEIKEENEKKDSKEEKKKIMPFIFEWRETQKEKKSEYIFFSCLFVNKKTKKQKFYSIKLYLFIWLSYIYISIINWVYHFN